MGVVGAMVIAFGDGGITSAAASVHANVASDSKLTVNDGVSPATLDESDNACAVGDQWGSNFYRQLVRYGNVPGPSAGTTVTDASKILPDVAESWTISKNGLVYTFHLNPKAKFNDGTEITSGDVKFTYERGVRLGSCGASFWPAEANGKQIKVSAPNPTTFVMTLKTPNSMQLASLGVPGPTAIYEQKAYEQHPDVAGQAVNQYWATHIAGGGGPFRLKQYLPNEKLVLVKNPAYDGPAPAHINEAVVNFGQSESTLLLDAKSGAADVTSGLNPSDLHSLIGTSGLRVLKFQAPLFYNLGLNDAVAPLTNIKVREALALAIPYGQLVSQVMDGFGNSYYGPMPPALPGFNAKSSAPLTENMSMAKTLLTQSGVSLPLNLTMVVLQGDPLAASFATVIESSWQSIGVNLTISTLGATAYSTTVEGKQDQTFIREDGPGVPVGAWLLGYDMVCAGPYNLSSICIPAADKLLQKAEATTNQAEQDKLYSQITKLWRADFPKIIIAGVDQGIVVSNKVKMYGWNLMEPSELNLVKF